MPILGVMVVCVFQNKLHKVCHVINFEPFVLGLWG